MHAGFNIMHCMQACTAHRAFFLLVLGWRRHNLRHPRFEASGRRHYNAFPRLALPTLGIAVRPLAFWPGHALLRGPRRRCPAQDINGPLDPLLACMLYTV